MTRLQLIDGVLGIIAVTDHSLNGIQYELKEMGIEYPDSTIEEMLSKLVRDFLIRKKRVEIDGEIGDAPEFENRYYINYEGRMFIEEGSYYGRKRRNDRAERIEKRNVSFLIFGSVGAALASLFLGAMEVIKLNWLQPRPAFWLEGGLLVTVGVVAGFLTGVLSVRIYLRKSR